MTEFCPDYYSFYLQNYKGQELIPISVLGTESQKLPDKSRDDEVFSLVATCGVPLVERHLFEPEEKPLFHFEGYLLLKSPIPENILALRPPKPLLIPFLLELSGEVFSLIVSLNLCRVPNWRKI